MQAEARTTQTGAVSPGEPTDEGAGVVRPVCSPWRRVLLFVWLGMMAAVVVTGTVGYLVHFFLLQR